MKADRFSQLAGEYAQYRPQYPQQLGAYLASLTPDHKRAWDCATGNGQAALALLPYFDHVIGTDLSPQQITHAFQAGPLDYAISTAEQPPFSTGSMDLVTVGQAIHWFDLDSFYPQVKRVLKPQGILAAWGYDQPRIEPAIDQLSYDYFNHILGSYLPARMQMVTQHYGTLPFPFTEITPPEMIMQTEWNLDHLVGMMSSLSPVMSYQDAHGHHPVEEIYDQLLAAWGSPEEAKLVHWPIFFKIGRRVSSRNYS